MRFLGRCAQFRLKLLSHFARHCVFSTGEALGLLQRRAFQEIEQSTEKNSAIYAFCLICSYNRQSTGNNKHQCNTRHSQRSRIQVRLLTRLLLR